MAMMKRQYIILGLVVYLLALLMTIPASLFSGQINKLHPQIQLSGIEGSLWHGRIEQLFIRQKPVQNVEWDFQPLALLLGRIQLGLTYADKTNMLQLDVAMTITNGLRISNTNGQLTAGFIQSFTPYAVPALHGTIFFDDLGLSLAGRYPHQAEGQIEWRGAVIDLGQKISIGNIQVLLPENEKGVKAVLTEKSGLLTGQAELILEGDGRYKIEARFTPSSKGRHLERHLALLLRKSADGSYQRTQSGQLP